MGRKNKYLKTQFHAAQRPPLRVHTPRPGGEPIDLNNLPRGGRTAVIPPRKGVPVNKSPWLDAEHTQLSLLDLEVADVRPEYAVCVARRFLERGAEFFCRPGCGGATVTFFAASDLPWEDLLRGLSVENLEVS